MLTSRRNHSFGGFKKSKERMFSAPRTDKSCCKNCFPHTRVEREGLEPDPPSTGSHRDTKSPEMEEAKRKIRELLVARLNYHCLSGDI